MNPGEIKNAIKILGGLFPGQLTEEQVKLLRDQLAPFQFDAALLAIKNHRTKHEFISFPQLMEGCRAAERDRSESVTGAARDGSIADVYRRVMPWLKGTGDIETVIRVYRQFWHKSSKSDSYRSKFNRECTCALISLGLPEPDAARWTATIFDEDVNYFSQVLEDLRDSQPSFACA